MNKFYEKTKYNRGAFTLAEVLITLGIIGIVAALTLPQLVQNYQKKVLQVQFKKFYTTFNNAIKYVQATNGAPVACYYWAKNPYNAVGIYAQCTETNDYGTCISWTAPSNYNGNLVECEKFTEDLMKALKVTKYCPNNALKNGCITNKHRGFDKVKFELNPDVEVDPNWGYSDSNLKNTYMAFVTPDSMIYMKTSLGSWPIFWVDINGAKGPNKYGYDIFTFEVKGTLPDGITKIVSSSRSGFIVEKGGNTFDEMLRK